jgi:hypothetical protein
MQVKTGLMRIALEDTHPNLRKAQSTKISLAKEDNVLLGEPFLDNNDTWSSYRLPRRLL